MSKVLQTEKNEDLEAKANRLLRKSKNMLRKDFLEKR